MKDPSCSICNDVAMWTLKTPVNQKMIHYCIMPRPHLLPHRCKCGWEWDSKGNCTSGTPGE